MFIYPSCKLVSVQPSKTLLVNVIPIHIHMSTANNNNIRVLEKFILNMTDAKFEKDAAGDLFDSEKSK